MHEQNRVQIIMLEEMENKQRDELYSKAVRAGKRTYFFDVKETKSGETYLTITESKKRFNQDQGKFFYEKHKLFLYKEDFEKFTTALGKTLHFIETGETPVYEDEDELMEDHEDIDTSSTPKSDYKDISFEDLDKE